MARYNLTQKLIKDHLQEGEMTPGSEIALTIDQALLQDATGTLVHLELEAMGLKKAQTELAVQYVDHNLLQTDHKNADDHEFLFSAAQRFGLWYSRPGNGVSHPVHMERFGIPGKTLLGSDSHTCAAGALGMLAIGTGGLDVAAALAGKPYYVKMPAVMGVKLTGKLPDWVSAKDIILEMLRRHGVKGGVGMVIEYYGDGLKELSAMDRHVIANMGAELGATTSVFPSDAETKRFLTAQKRGNDWQELLADEGCRYEFEDEIVLDDLVPLIARPGSPGNVVTVEDVAGLDVHQCVIGSSANPGLRDFWVVGEILSKHSASPTVSLDINPSSRQVLQNLTKMGSVGKLIMAGARLHQSGCMGCIGMGQAPAAGKISLRTMPRNFPGRSGTLDDKVFLCSPETAAATALTGKITDPRTLESEFGIAYPRFEEPDTILIKDDLLVPPPEAQKEVKLVKGKNIKSLPELKPLRDSLEMPVLLRMGDNVSTDEILKAGAEVLPLRSNLPAISKYAFQPIDAKYHNKSQEALKDYEGHLVVAGENYAQGSSREHAALAPRYLGQVAVIAQSYARIGWQNLVNFGILPLEFIDDLDYDRLQAGDMISIKNLRESVAQRKTIKALVKAKMDTFEMDLEHSLSDRQIEVLLEGGIINYFKARI